MIRYYRSQFDVYTLRDFDVTGRNCTSNFPTLSHKFTSAHDLYFRSKQQNGRLDTCSREANCVSSSYNEPPNVYVSPLTTVNEPTRAFERAVRDLREGKFDFVDIKPSSKYIHVTVPGTAPSSLDDVELVFSSEGTVNVRCEARVTIPPPPFCVKRNCINGNMDQRTRVERLATVLGLPFQDREVMAGAKWTPIFFNSDKVPGFDDDLHY